MTPTKAELRIRCAEALAMHQINALGLVPFQRPIGTEGYKCDLSGCWIYKAGDGRLIGINYPKQEDLFTGLIKDFAKKNYPEDLNACAELRASLTEEERGVFTLALHKVVFGSHASITAPLMFEVINATAEQHCRAFLAAVEGRKA